ncbi:MAG: hypothetical protein JWM11_4936 [Planctomycetaceae bacterium]|nr:hypothetical protein [Planctomycetaceae bacterium]
MDSYPTLPQDGILIFQPNKIIFGEKVEVAVYYLLKALWMTPPLGAKDGMSDPTVWHLLLRSLRGMLLSERQIWRTYHPCNSSKSCRTELSSLSEFAMRVVSLYASVSGNISSDEFRRRAKALHSCHELAKRFSLEDINQNYSETVRAATNSAIESALDSAAEDSVYAAICSTAHTVYSITRNTGTTAAPLAADAAFTATAAVANSVDIVEAAWRDFGNLVTAANGIPRDDFLIDPSEDGVLGRLWPWGPPEWYTIAILAWEVALHGVGLDQSGRDLAHSRHQ